MKMPVHPSVPPMAPVGANFVHEFLRVGPETAALHVALLAANEIADLMNGLQALGDFVFDLKGLLEELHEMDLREVKDLTDKEPDPWWAFEAVMGAISTGPEIFLSRVASLPKQDRPVLIEAMQALDEAVRAIQAGVGDHASQLSSPH